MLITLLLLLLLLFFDDDNDNDDNDNDNCGNGGGSVGCRGGDNYFKTEDYLYNNYNQKMLYKVGLRRPIYWLERHLDLQAPICRSQ